MLSALGLHEDVKQPSESTNIRKFHLFITADLTLHCVLVALPKVMREALNKFIDSDVANKVALQLQSLIEEANAEAAMADGDDQEPPDTELQAILEEWEEGIEQYKHMSTAQLFSAMGLPSTSTTFPYFNELMDMTEDGVTPHDVEEWDAWVKKGNVGPLKPKWHQVVGVYAMLTNMLEGKPVLLMDEVGVGKTMQAFGLMVMRAYLIKMVNDGGRLPKKWGKSYLYS